MYYLAKIVRTILLILPRRVNLFLGKIIGLFIYFNSNKRNNAFKNIKLAFPLKSNKELFKILRRSFINFGISIVETFIPQVTFKYVQLKNIEQIEKEKGILVGIHEGSWELYNALLAKHFQYVIFVKEQRNKSLDRFLNELRRKEKIMLTSSLKEFIKYLRNNYLVGLSFDHGVKEDSVFIRFFNHLVLTPRGAVFLAKKYNKKIYPGFGYRLSDFSHILEFSSPIAPEGLTEEEILLKLNRIYETYITKYPAEYLWTYKRFKRKKNLEVLIISDGKVGHFKQSEAFLSFLNKEKEKEYEINSKVIQIRYKNFLARIFSELCAIFSSRGCLGCGLCLKFILPKDIREKIEKTYADIVISTGSFSASINRIFSSILGAKSITILRSNIPLSRFDLVILPEHDRVSGSNVVKIKGALFSDSGLDEKIKKCKEFFNFTDLPKISLFLGGHLYDEEEFIKNTMLFIDKIKDFSLKYNYRLLISTSRRTPKRVEKFLKEALCNFSNAEAVVYANCLNYDFIFEGFVYFSKYVFVSSESISMISEVISLKKPCVCVFLEKMNTKHKVFLKSIENEVNFLNKPYDIKDISFKTSNLFEENEKIIKYAIKRFL